MNKIKIIFPDEIHKRLKMTNKDHIIEILSCFSSKEFQSKAWVEGDKTIVFDPGEFINWFDDLRISELAGLTDTEKEIVIPIINEINEFTKTGYIQEMYKINIKEWIHYEPWVKIRNMSMNAVTDLKK